MPEPIPAWQPPLLEKFVSTDSSNVLIHYLGDVFDWHGYIKFLSLAALRETSRDVPLEKLFVEPHVSPQHLSPDALEVTPPPPTQGLAAALAEHPRLVLLGDPGSGKSTVVNWICTALGRGMDGPLAKLLGGPLVPLPLILRELGIGSAFAEIEDVGQRWHALLAMFLHRPVATHLLVERERHGGNVNDSLAAKILESGQALVLLDGIDEIGDIEIREALRDAVHEAMRRYPSARWVMTSRIVGYAEVDFSIEERPKIVLIGKAPEKGSNFLERVDIHVDTYPETEDLAGLALDIATDHGCQGYVQELPCSLANRELFRVITMRPVAAMLHLAPFNDAQVENFTRLWWAHHESNPHLAGTKPAQFLGALRQSHGARSLARLPHLLTMIALIYRVRAELPDGRALLYGFIADAYLGTLDKERGLEHLRPIPHNVDEMCRWLAAVGWELQQRRGLVGGKEQESGASAESETLLRRDEILEVLDQAIRPKASPVSSQAPLGARDTGELFLEYAGRRSGLLLPRGQDAKGRDLYAFLHLSFQEYFAALHWRDEVTDPEWWEGSSEPISTGMTLPDLRRCATLPAWHETLIFLWESVSLISPKLPQRLIAALFGWKRDPSAWGHFPAPTVKLMQGERKRGAVLVETERVFLGASLAVDPHFELSEEARAALLERCWSYEISLQNSAGATKDWGDFYAARLPALLLSRAACLRESVRCLLSSVARTTSHALNLNGCSALADLTPLGELTDLRRLYLKDCTALSDLTPLGRLTRLRWLNLGGCNALTDLSPLSGLAGLRGLGLGGCTALDNFAPLAGLNGLQELNLGGCTGLSDLIPLAGLRGLQELNLYGCIRLSDLIPLAGLRGLQDLDLRSCTGLRNLTPLTGLTRLKFLRLQRCSAVSEEQIEKLRRALPKTIIVT